MSEEEDTRERLKTAAMRLFSQLGIDGVAVRDIVQEAGARNSASIHYYFRTKAALVDELVSDAARRSDEARSLALDALEASGRRISARDAVRIIIDAETVGTGHPEQRRDLPIGFGHMRFVAAMQQGHRAQFMDAVGQRWDRSYVRCLDHIRADLPELPPSVVSHRLLFLNVSLTSILATREAAFIADPHRVTLWTHPDLLDNLADMLVEGIIAPAGPGPALPDES